MLTGESGFSFIFNYKLQAKQLQAKPWPVFHPQNSFQDNLEKALPTPIVLIKAKTFLKAVFGTNQPSHPPAYQQRSTGIALK